MMGGAVRRRAGCRGSRLVPPRSRKPFRRFHSSGRESGALSSHSEGSKCFKIKRDAFRGFLESGGMIGLSANAVVRPFLLLQPNHHRIPEILI